MRLLRSCLQGFPDERDERAFAAYKTGAVLQLAGLVLVVEMAVVALLQVSHNRATSSVSRHLLSGGGPGRAAQAAYLLALLLPLTAPVLADCWGGRAPGAKARVFHERERLLCVGQGVAAAAACVAFVSGEQLLRDFLAALGAYPVPLLLYGQALRMGALRMPLKRAAFCAAACSLEHFIALHASRFPGGAPPPPGAAARAVVDGAPGAALDSRLLVLLALSALAGVVLAASGDNQLRRRWACEQQLQGQKPIGAPPLADRGVE